MPETPWFPLHLQISARARVRLALPEEAIAPLPGAGFFPYHLIAQRLRAAQLAETGGAELNLLAQLSRVFRHVAQEYFAARACTIGRSRLRLAGDVKPCTGLDALQATFVAAYPPAPGHPVPDAEQDEAVWRREAAIELFILAGQLRNPAAASFVPLFDPAELEVLPWRATVAEIDRLLAAHPVPGRLGRPLLTLLHEPVLAAPDSLAGQLRYVREAWRDLLSPELLEEILIAFDLVAEAEQLRGFGGGSPPVPSFGGGDYDEPERYSSDSDWMPNTVLIAKTVYVWLDQLSRRYSRPIEHLDQIPDEELDRLGRQGFTSLWLIGIWERSPASEKIKRLMGNHEAVASAYSLFDYVVAADLGGEGALHQLQERCRVRGIRLACDVVPNHTGIDSRWTREHPDWYVQVDHPPYPAYRFSGPNLSSCDGTELYIEDGYWQHSDAAVVFKHVQHGRVRYLYHGNDGTHLPWNDTAQLNFLLPEVREAMIRTIVHVARSFPVIRFDAAMTLAKKHYQRLWFPQPGGGAGVPSRAEHALSRADFDRLFPVEFWREVVDRVAVEAPDTLLLAEAFWLMEGYFVRTLGMHRVYNSAFMNMLKHEDNAKYRTVLKNILEFDTGILQRFVNFMNNPDEETAVAQFGKGSKYFGVATLLATMPGLPMFGHGQIEGLQEKYGMEFRRPRYDESPDEGFMGWHESQIFPLLRRRPLFSGAQDFVLYDFFCHGQVNEDVFAYSNRRHDERALVVVHNRHADVDGWVRTSVAKRVRDASGERLTHPTLGEALGLAPAPARLWRFRDQGSGREYLHRSIDLFEQGLHLVLGPYAYHVFLDWREVTEDGVWGELCRRLDGRPVVSLDREWRELRHAGLYAAARSLWAPETLHTLLAPFTEKGGTTIDAAVERFARFLACLGEEKVVAAEALATIRRQWRAVHAAVGDDPLAVSSFLPVWLMLRQSGDGTTLAACLEETGLLEVLAECLPEEPRAQLMPALLRHATAPGLTGRLVALFAAPAVGTFLGRHSWDGREFVQRERLEMLLATVEQLATAEAAAGLAALRQRCARLLAAAEAGGYAVEKFSDLL